MQGRVMPDSTERLQIFPQKWREEFSAIKKLGFDYIELLDDKAGCFRKFLRECDIIEEVNKTGLKCETICGFSLGDYSLFKNEDLFFKKLEELVSAFRGKNIIILVPFIFENKFNDQKELRSILEKLSRYDNSLDDKNLYLSLEIDLPAKMIKDELQKFSFKNIGICYDLGNNIEYGYSLYDDIILLKDYINHIHIKDKEDGKNIRLRGNLEQLRGAFKAIKEISFKGPMILETCIAPNPLEEAERNLKTVEEYINKIN